jgi:hypothetical protein
MRHLHRRQPETVVARVFAMEEPTSCSLGMWPRSASLPLAEHLPQRQSTPFVLIWPIRAGRTSADQSVFRSGDGSVRSGTGLSASSSADASTPSASASPGVALSWWFVQGELPVAGDSMPHDQKRHGRLEVGSSSCISQSLHCLRSTARTGFRLPHTTELQDALGRRRRRPWLTHNWGRQDVDRFAHARDAKVRVKHGSDGDSNPRFTPISLRSGPSRR